MTTTVTGRSPSPQFTMRNRSAPPASGELANA
jgi:hypothetical protein